MKTSMCYLNRCLPRSLRIVNQATFIFSVANNKMKKIMSNRAITKRQDVRERCLQSEKAFALDQSKPVNKEDLQSIVKDLVLADCTYTIKVLQRQIATQTELPIISFSTRVDQFLTKTTQPILKHDHFRRLYHDGP